ncbi:sulfurtransferase TusA family protein [Paracoccus alkenifer]|uniref:tRNA 2-thiouridine synthesizing protein A n=1 Tax=Paracoccus alkenifer TaxID=65735 RepID=A0A1H6MD73_9RHOB|nr:sulfurtransferase TusA family protein [Paracoccus alkenifer]SEH95485.1 tRNA 2-thiouridine synthesizing protein A [Paracoccus alkenifer]
MPAPDPVTTPATHPAPAARIDARHLLCPLPVLRLRRALQGLAPGAVVALEATDAAAVLDVPHFCAEAGHELLFSAPLPDGARRYLVRRG